jgi:hypothetical protein
MGHDSCVVACGRWRLTTAASLSSVQRERHAQRWRSGRLHCRDLAAWLMILADVIAVLVVAVVSTTRRADATARRTADAYA